VILWALSDIIEKGKLKMCISKISYLKLVIHLVIMDMCRCVSTELPHNGVYGGGIVSLHEATTVKLVILA
jgi:hypothetical protein